MDKVVGISMLCRFVKHGCDLFFRTSLNIQSVTHVFSDGAREQDRLLLNDSQLLMVPTGVQVFDVDAIELNRALVRVIEPLHQSNDTRLSTSTLATQGNHSFL